MKERVYLAGKITGDPHYKSKFYTAMQQLEDAGMSVINPAFLPGDAFTWEQYIRMGQAMLEPCDAICLLPDWRDSLGAAAEYGRAFALGKRVFEFEQWLKEQDVKKRELALSALLKKANPAFCVEDEYHICAAGSMES